MSKDQAPGRRDFLKTVGGALIAGGLLPGEANAATAPMDDVLNGVIEMHVHADPDVRPRSIDQIALARKAQQMGFRAYMFKGHDWCTADNAYLIRSAVPNFEVFGGLAMNRTHGTAVNPEAAEMAFKISGRYCRCIWMPTYQSAWDTSKEGLTGGIPVLDSNGKVLPEVVKVMEICGANNAIFATGHSSPAECVIMAKKAKEVGIAKFVVTHSTQNIWRLSLDQAKQVVETGGYLEHSFLAALVGPGSVFPTHARTSVEEMAEYIRIAPEKSFISTDLGQAMMPSPIDGMRAFINGLKKAGLSGDQIDIAARKVPAKLLGLD
ncbi:MAG: DUF6282 family protein [Syntrophobacter sp.]